MICISQRDRVHYRSNSLIAQSKDKQLGLNVLNELIRSISGKREWSEGKFGVSKEIYVSEADAIRLHVL